MSRSKIDALPKELRDQLNQTLIERGFRGYEGLEHWLAEQGYSIGKSSIHRHGAKLEHRLSQLTFASEQAKAFVESVPDDEGAMSEATIRLFQERIFNLMLAFEDGSMRDLASAGRAVADVTRAATTVRQERRRAISDAAQAVDAIARKRGLTADTAAAIRAAIEGAE